MVLKNKIALITGAASGLGLSITRELLQDGIKGLTIADVNPIAGVEVLQALGKEFGMERLLFAKTDVTNDYEYDDAFKKTIAKFGQVDIVINNAGIANEVNYNLTVNINLTAVIRGTSLGLRYMGKDVGKHGGIIINTSSIAAVETQEIFPIYASTKAAVLNLVQGWGHPVHYNRTGVKIIALCPGYTETPIQSKGVLQGDTAHLLANQAYQKPESVGRAAVYVIQNAESGSAWMIDQNKLYTMNVPNWHSYSKVIVEKMA